MERHFTRKDVEEKLLGAIKPLDGQTLKVASVELLQETESPMWLVEVEISWTNSPPSMPSIHTYLFAEKQLLDKPWLTWVNTDAIPAGCSSPEEEDAAIEQQNAERARRTREWMAAHGKAVQP